jgi:hypothetical protein
VIKSIAEQKKLDVTTVHQKLALLEPLGLTISEEASEPEKTLPQKLPEKDIGRLSTADLATLRSIFPDGDIYTSAIYWSFILRNLMGRRSFLLQNILSAVRSLVLLGHEVPCTSELAPQEIELLDRFIDGARPFSTRVLDGLNRANGPAGWDIGLAAVMLRQPVTEFADVIACFEKLGLNVSDCRAFIDSRKTNASE